MGEEMVFEVVVYGVRRVEGGEECERMVGGGKCVWCGCVRDERRESARVATKKKNGGDGWWVFESSSSGAGTEKGEG